MRMLCKYSFLNLISCTSSALVWLNSWSWGSCVSNWVLWARYFNLNFSRFIRFWRSGSPTGLPSDVTSSRCHFIFTILQVLTVLNDYLNKLITPRRLNIFSWDISASIRICWDTKCNVPFFYPLTNLLFSISFFSYGSLKNEPLLVVFELI